MTNIYTAPEDCSTLEPYYSLHVSAMTGEQLFLKSRIAAELAYRDKKIQELEERVADLNRDLCQCQAYLDAGLQDGF